MIEKSNILANLEIIRTTIENFNGLDTSATPDHPHEITSLQATATETQASAKYWLLSAIGSGIGEEAEI
jgi:hypothetical protein